MLPLSRRVTRVLHMHGDQQNFTILCNVYYSRSIPKRYEKDDLEGYARDALTEPAEVRTVGDPWSHS